MLWMEQWAKKLSQQNSRKTRRFQNIPQLVFADLECIKDACCASRRHIMSFSVHKQFVYKKTPPGTFSFFFWTDDSLTGCIKKQRESVKCKMTDFTGWTRLRDTSFCHIKQPACWCGLLLFFLPFILYFSHLFGEFILLNSSPASPAAAPNFTADYRHCGTTLFLQETKTKHSRVAQSELN